MKIDIKTSGCNPCKDLAQCRAAAKFYPLEQRCFFTGYLWETQRAMQASVFDDSEFSAITCHVPYFESFKPGGIICSPKRGEMHFYAGGWDNEVVAHECLHASFGFARAFGVNPNFAINGDGELSPHFWGEHGDMDGIISDEELLCYIHGQLVSGVIKWLWEHDPSGKWRRVVESADA